MIPLHGWIWGFTFLQLLTTDFFELGAGVVLSGRESISISSGVELRQSVDLTFKPRSSGSSRPREGSLGCCAQIQDKREINGSLQDLAVQPPPASPILPDSSEEVC